MSAKKSSSTNGWLTVPACLILAAGLGGCVDYVKRRDTVTFGAGDAQAWNKTVHTADPWPPYAMNNNIPGDGRRTAVVMQRYSTGNAGAAQDSNSSEGSEAEKD
jgi:hypothetical protein